MMMSEKRFSETERNCYYTSLVFDNQTQEELGTTKAVDLLNKQQDIIITLKKRLEKINHGYGHLTHRNGLTANEWVIESQEKELKKQNKLIQNLKEDNDNCKNDYRELFSNYVMLEEENEQLQKKNEELNMVIMNDILDKYKIAFEEVKRGADILKDLCPTCIYFINYEAEVSSEGYVRTTKCIKRGKIKGVLNECDDYKKEWEW